MHLNDYDNKYPFHLHLMVTKLNILYYNTAVRMYMTLC